MVTYLGSLVQLCCGEGETLQTNIAGMCGECAQCIGHTGLATVQGYVCFWGLHCSGSRVLCKAVPKAGPAFRALPRTKWPGFSGTPQGHRLGWACFLCASQVQAAQASRCFVSTLSQVGRASQSPPWSWCLGFLGVPQPFQGCHVSPLGS